MPNDRTITARGPISARSGGALANGLSGRPPLAPRTSEGRGIAESPRQAAGPTPAIDQDTITRGLISGGAFATPETYARLFPPQAAPATPARPSGPFDPFDTLSDVFRSVFGPDLSGRTDRQQALTPVTTGGGGSPMVWILVLGGIGVAVYFYYKNRSRG